MPLTVTPLAPDEVLPEPIVRPTANPREQVDLRRQPPYAVVLHNDDINGMDFVVGVLRKVLNCGRIKAVWLMMRAHCAGRCNVWVGSLEVAELKADQIRSCGPDPKMVHWGAQPLQVSLEPQPI